MSQSPSPSSSAGGATSPTPSSKMTARQRVLLSGIALAQLMLVLDVTAINVALPDIGASLGFTPTALPWVVTAYILMLGGLMLLGGRVADRVGHKRMVLIGLAAFVLTSLIASAAWNPSTLILARSAQGASAAFLSPAALAAVTVGFTGRARQRALGLWGAIGGVGAALGVILSGLLTSGPGWRWIFIINVPLGLIAIAIIVALLPSDRAADADADAAEATRRRAPIGVFAGITVTAAMGTALLALTTSTATGWLSPLPGVELGAAAVLFALFVFIERRSSNPLIDIGLLTDRRVGTGSLIMLVSSGLLIGLFFLLSFDFQHRLGWSALNTGLAFLPMASGTLVGAHLAGYVVARLGPRIVGTIAIGITAVGLGLASWYGDATPLVIIGVGVAAAGLGAGFVTGTTTALGEVEHAHAGVVSGIVNTSHEFGGALGVSALAGSIGAAGAAHAGLAAPLGVMATIALALALVSAVAIPRGTPSPGSPHLLH